MSSNEGAAALAAEGAEHRRVLPPALPAKLYTYGDEGYDDVGWGCGYRCLQTLLSAHDAASVPSIGELISAMGEVPGHFADAGDIVLHLQSKHGWTASMLQISVRSEMDEFLHRVHAKLNDPSHRYTWGLMGGGGVMFLLADVDVAGRRVQIFDPHGPNDGTGMQELSRVGEGGFGWIDLTALLLGSADPGIAAHVEPDELMIMMNWMVIFFDRLGESST